MTQNPFKFDTISQESDFDLPSPTLISRSGASTPDLFSVLPTSSVNPHFRDPSFSAEYSNMYDVQPEPAKKRREDYESPKFSGSSVFHSRIVTPISISPAKKHDLHYITPSPKHVKPIHLLPSLANTRKDRSPLSSSRKTDGLPVYKPPISFKKVPKLDPVVPGDGIERSIGVNSARYWVKTPGRRMELAKVLGYTPKRQWNRVVNEGPKPPTAGKAGKSPLTARYVGRGIETRRM